MSPEIRIGTKTVINVPDQTGMYETPAGEPLYVNTDLIEASNQTQEIILRSDVLGGVRVLGLTQQGIGRSDDPKRGDGKLPKVSVKLHDRPIRVSYTRYDSMLQRHHHMDTNKNPRWVKGHGQR